MGKPSKELTENRIAIIKAMEFAVNKMRDDGHYDSIVKIVKEITNDIKTNKNKHFVCSDPLKDLAVTYAKDINCPFDPDKRIDTNIGRYIRRQLGFESKTISDTTLDCFCNHINTYLVIKRPNGFKILEQKELLSFYKEVTGKFTSCMSGDQYFRVEIYALNPESVKLLTYKREGRALIWTCDDGTKYMDHVYSNSKFTYMFNMWAVENKYYTWNSRPAKAMTVNLKYNRYLPSIDTFNNAKFDHSTKTVKLSSNPFDGSERISVNNLTVPGVDPLKCAHVDCGKVLPDEDEYKTKRGSPVCPECRRFLFTCQHCNIEEVVIGDYNFCSKCEEELIKRCANIYCGKRGNKFDMIKMKKLNTDKFCFVCHEKCMKLINPSWAMEA